MNGEARKTLVKQRGTWKLVVDATERPPPMAATMSSSDSTRNGRGGRLIKENSNYPSQPGLRTTNENRRAAAAAAATASTAAADPPAAAAASVLSEFIKPIKMTLLMVCIIFFLQCLLSSWFQS